MRTQKHIPHTGSDVTEEPYRIQPLSSILHLNISFYIDDHGLPRLPFRFSTLSLFLPLCFMRSLSLALFLLLNFQKTRGWSGSATQTALLERKTFRHASIAQR